MGLEAIRGSAAFVTGASSGIGEGMAKMLARAGVRVALSARRREELERAAGEIRAEGGEALVFPADLRDGAALTGAFESARAALGPIDILVNSGGVMLAKPIHDTAAEEWDMVLETNLRSAALLCSAALPEMRERRRGTIINIASEAGVFYFRNMAAYAVSKHALRALTELIMVENQGFGVRAWAICPGFVDTPMGGWAERTNPKNFLTVDEVVDTARFLLGQDANVKMGPEILMRTMKNPYGGG